VRNLRHVPFHGCHVRSLRHVRASVGTCHLEGGLVRVPVLAHGVCQARSKPQHDHRDRGDHDHDLNKCFDRALGRHHVARRPSGTSGPASAPATWGMAWYGCQSWRTACARPVPSPRTITGIAETTITISTGALTVPWDAITWYAACPAMPRTREPRADHLANR